MDFNVSLDEELVRDCQDDVRLTMFTVGQKEDFGRLFGHGKKKEVCSMPAPLVEQSIIRKVRRKERFRVQ